MEIYKFTKNQSAINRRKTLPKFGSISKISVVENIDNFSFIKCTNDKIEIKEEVEVEHVAYTPNISYKPKEETVINTGQYIPPVSTRSYENISVKISNYDLNMKREELYRILSQHTKVKFGRFHMVFDRETGVSRGYSFVSVGNKEEASELINDLKVVIIDNLRLCVELAKNK
ncbi:eukaryotic translation initiation factor 3 subunit G [Vairimorpha necatrix]|uniref:Eukaryotic translation initiation factor 3 subunit G n=1 Tax=Vairimorpha necatrix TaxID=6039 RepID=A0AAX4JD39_9MICR